MWRPTSHLLLLTAAASCGGSRDSHGAQIALTSSAFGNGAAIPREFSCEGANGSPPLAWGDPPHGTKSLALIVDDPDAPGGTFGHWGLFDIPASTRSITAGQQVGTEALNDMGKPGYGGPCPPKGHGPHHYHFKLLALDVPRLGLERQMKVGDVERAAEKHLVGRGELTGTYERR